MGKKDRKERPGKIMHEELQKQNNVIDICQ